MREEGELALLWSVEHIRKHLHHHGWKRAFYIFSGSTFQHFLLQTPSVDPLSFTTYPSRNDILQELYVSLCVCVFVFVLGRVGYLIEGERKTG